MSDVNLDAVHGTFTFVSGYMGDENAWCYWETERPEEGSVGPFSTQDEAIKSAMCVLEDTDDVE